MAAVNWGSRMRGISRNALDLPVAALAGISAAFAAFAVPAELLEAVAEATGLAAIVPAAAPPLGTTARLAAVAAAAVAGFAAVFSILRLIDRLAGAVPAAEEAEGEEPIRTRRRDFHPDAPARRPISALRDLGEPEDAVPEPIWLSEADPGDAFAQPEPEPEPKPELEPEPEPVQELTDPPQPEPLLREPVPTVVEPGSVAELIARLERGLERRRARKPAVEPARSPAPEPQAPPLPDDRLQNAIASLQRIAARQA